LRNSFFNSFLKIYKYQNFLSFMPSEEYELMPTDPVEKLVDEVEGLKNDLATLKNEIKK